MSTIAAISFKIANTKLYVPVVTLSSKDNAKLVKLLEGGFNRPVCWDEYQTKIETRNLDKTILQDFLLMLLFKELEDCLFLFLIILLLMMVIIQLTILLIESKETVRKYFLPRVNITSYNELIDGRNFYDQPINNMIKQYSEIRKMMIT